MVIKVSRVIFNVVYWKLQQKFTYNRVLNGTSTWIGNLNSVACGKCRMDTNTNDIARHLSPDEAEIESISDVIFFQWDACNEVTSNRRDQRNDSHFLSPRTDRHNRNTIGNTNESPRWISDGGFIIVAISHLRNNVSRTSLRMFYNASC